MFFVWIQAALNFTAKDALQKSCFLKIDFKISENSTVYDAVKRMSAHRVGALAVTSSSDNDKIIGIVSERDYLCKVALLGKQSRTTLVNEICTQGESNLISVEATDSVDECMRKVLASDVRHLLVRDSQGKIVSLFSIKDLCKCVVAKHNEVVQRLTDFGVGKGAFFGSE